MKRPITREWRHHYIKRLKRLGIEHIGDGYNAHVFQHPTIPEVAIKVVDATDRQFFKFMRWSISHPWNVWVPKYHSVQMFDCINERGYAIIFCERLQKIGGEEFKLFINETLGCDQEDLSVECLEKAMHFVQSDDLRSLIQFILTRYHAMDLHRGNFMKRGEQIVFVDPLAGP